MGCDVRVCAVSKELAVSWDERNRSEALYFLKTNFPIFFFSSTVHNNHLFLVGLFVCGGSLTSGQLFMGSFQTERPIYFHLMLFIKILQINQLGPIN